jgi:hypothetical protein
VAAAVAAVGLQPAQAHLGGCPLYMRVVRVSPVFVNTSIALPSSSTRRDRGSPADTWTGQHSVRAKCGTRRVCSLHFKLVCTKATYCPSRCLGHWQGVAPQSTSAQFCPVNVTGWKLSQAAGSSNHPHPPTT